MRYKLSSPDCRPHWTAAYMSSHYGALWGLPISSSWAALFDRVGCPVKQGIAQYRTEAQREEQGERVEKGARGVKVQGLLGQPNRTLNRILYRAL